MNLFLCSGLALLIVTAIIVTILRRRSSRRIRVSELWKGVFGIILFSMSSGFDEAGSTLRAPKIVMFAFACFLLLWCLYSLIVSRRSKNLK